MQKDIEKQTRREKRRRQQRAAILICVVLILVLSSLVGYAIYQIFHPTNDTPEIPFEEEEITDLNPEGVEPEIPLIQDETEQEEMEQVSYMEERNIEPMPLEIGACYMSEGVLFSFLNPEGTAKIAPCWITVNDLTSTIQDGKTQTHLELELIMQGEYGEDGINRKDCVTPIISLMDSYSGLVLPDKTLRRDAEYENLFLLPWNAKQQEIEMAYTCKAVLEEGSWVDGDSGRKQRSLTFRVSYEVTTPQEYDGLLWCIEPVVEYDEAVINEDEIADEGHYLQEDMENHSFMKEGILFLRH